MLQYGAFEIALRHVKLNSLSIPKEDLAIVFPVALYEVNCFWIEGVVSDGNKRHGKACSHQLRTELADNGGGLNGSTQHSAQNPHSLKTKAKSAG